MRHAYLIIAHAGWGQLKRLISLLDGDYCDIYIHIDKKANDVPREELIGAASRSKVFVMQEYEVYWGSFELVQTELMLFSEAHKKHYDYYHLLSGADLPIKPQQEIYSFFEANAGKEFVHYDTDTRLRDDKEIGRRTRLYHFLQNYRRRFKVKALNSLFTFMERVLLLGQLLLHVDRMKKHQNFQIRYGSQWVSITDDLIEYILENEGLINDIFKYTNCADELFIQSLVYNSRFRRRLYNQKYDDSCTGNMRLIDMKIRGANGNPYIWRLSDWQEIFESECLFGRKFSEQLDSEMIDAVCSRIHGRRVEI